MSEYYPGPPPMESEEPDAQAGPGEGAGSDLSADATQRNTEGGSSGELGSTPGPAVPTGAAGPSPIAPKEYYSISEVCELVGLKPHVLRYWESQFPVLNPSKNRSGNRVYQRKEIKLVLLVQHLLYKEKYTIEGARQKLDQLRRGGTSGELAQATASAVSAEMRKLLRDELTQLLDVLSPPSTGADAANGTDGPSGAGGEAGTPE